MEKICINGRDALFVLDLAKVACFNPNRSLETELALFLMTAIRKMWLYIVGS